MSILEKMLREMFARLINIEISDNVIQRLIPVIDGVTQASALPQPGGLPESAGTVSSHAWDCRDRNGDPIPHGTYTVQMEITWERADGLGHTRPCETYPGEFPCSFRYSASIALGASDSVAAFAESDWMASSSQITFTAD